MSELFGGCSESFYEMTVFEVFLFSVAQCEYSEGADSGSDSEGGFEYFEPWCR
ncbi:hypothetical protein GCM10027027_17420 [Neomicrococcus lactis]